MKERNQVSDGRLDSLHAWLRDDLGEQNYSLEAASADASFRRYFRLKTSDRTCIVMDAPPDKETCESFVCIATVFKQWGLNVPEVLAHDLSRGFLLLSDLGQQQYLPILSDDNVDALYQDAMTALLVLQVSPLESIELPLYDYALLWQEMALFEQWFIRFHLEWQLTTDDEILLHATCDMLAKEALAQPQVCVHRDYHSRNLMVTQTANPGVLDFQDAVIGAVTYDLVSLLKDCYIVWPRDQVERWVAQFHERLMKRKMIDNVSAETFLYWFDLMGLQRHLKVLGIFSRLYYRDAKVEYMDDIPRVLEYVLDVAMRYPQLNHFAELMHRVAAQYAEQAK